MRVAAACLAFFAGMVGLAYASVPLYELFCRVTGFGGTTQVADTAPVQVLDRTMTVRFDANTDTTIGWDFEPVDRSVTLNVGELKQVSYTATSNRYLPSTGSATFNVTPQAAGAYFNKMECFCFTETTLQPGEGMEMPVVFFIDPSIVDAPELQNISTITLSYTFFEVDTPTQTAETTAVAPVTSPDGENGPRLDSRG